MDPMQFSETFVLLLIACSVALLLFVICVTVYMILSLSDVREKRRRHKMFDPNRTLERVMEMRFRQNLWGKR